MPVVCFGDSPPGPVLCFLIAWWPSFLGATPAEDADPPAPPPPARPPNILISAEVSSMDEESTGIGLMEAAPFPGAVPREFRFALGESGGAPLGTVSTGSS